MFDKQLCKIVNKKEISIYDIADYLVERSIIVGLLLIISLVILLIYMWHIIAVDLGVTRMLVYLAIAILIALVIRKSIGNYIIAECPNKKE